MNLIDRVHMVTELNIVLILAHRNHVEREEVAEERVGIIALDDVWCCGIINTFLGEIGTEPHIIHPRRHLHQELARIEECAKVVVLVVKVVVGASVTKQLHASDRVDI